MFENLIEDQYFKFCSPKNLANTFKTETVCSQATQTRTPCHTQSAVPNCLLLTKPVRYFLPMR